MTSATDWHPGDLSGLDVSSHAFTRTVDALTADELAGPSLLPGWSRAHVVAHVAMNAAALSGVVEGLVHGSPVPMYASDGQRDAEIEELAGADPTQLRERFLETTTRFADAIPLLAGEHWSGWIERLPGGPAWPMVTIVATRRRELEIHHADLGVAHTRADWPRDFVAELLDAVTVDQQGSGPFQVRASDLGQSWRVGGDGGPTVLGAGADLGWWLTRRGPGDGLSTDADRLPELGPWVRASARST